MTRHFAAGMMILAVAGCERAQVPPPSGPPKPKTSLSAVHDVGLIAEDRLLPYALLETFND